MAIVTAVTGELVPFPVEKQRRSLEPDGIFFAQIAVTGDGTGGNNQFRVRAPTSHLYVLRALHMEHVGTTNPGSPVVTGFAEWLSDATTFAMAHSMAYSSIPPSMLCAAFSSSHETSPSLESMSPPVRLLCLSNNFP